MNKILTFLLAVCVLPVLATTDDLLPGSIDFDTPALWGKSVYFGFDDSGTYKGATRWYLGDAANGGKIFRHDNSASGYLQTGANTELHRTLNPLTSTEETGPTAENGYVVPDSGLYIDMRLTLTGHPVLTNRVTSSRDKVNVWLHIPEDGSSTNLVITAGAIDDAGQVSVTNYLAGAVVTSGKEFQLTIRMVPNAFKHELNRYAGFEIYVDGAKVSCGEQTIFPSMLSYDDEYAAKLYSCGFSGSMTVEKLNFTAQSPIDDPTYDQADVTMLREYATITVSGYPSTREALAGFPMLVRISEKTIRNFYYSRAGANGRNLRFVDENGKLVPHEVEYWDTSGESLVWVRVPYYRHGATITMHWGLEEGATPPSVSSSAVWDDYIGVWHFADLEKGQALDSTGHGLTGKSEEGTLTATNFLGSAGVASTNAAVQVTDYDKLYPVNGTFTVTGWFCEKDILSLWGGAAKELFGKRTGSATGSTGLGWNAVSYKTTTFTVFGDGDKMAVADIGYDVRQSWFHGALVYSNGTLTVYGNGEVGGSVATTVTAVETNFLMMAGGLAADEVRLASVVRSADWIWAECEQGTNVTLQTCGNAVVKGMDNYWVVEPYVKPTAVDVGEVETQVVYAGQPRFGTPYIKYYDLAGHDLGASKPVEPGTYTMAAIVNSDIRDGLRKELAFVIYEKRAYHKITGYDRVMLFNSDTTPGAEVSLQGYYDVDSETNLVWEHVGKKWGGKGKFVLPGTEHTYFTPNTQRDTILWTFRHARIGNLFQSDYSLTDGMNFLPWGGYSRRYADSERPANAQRYAGTLILQNVSTQSSEDDPAAAYSPFYKDGIGTIYFDAVNAYVDFENTLKVQICGTEESDVRDGAWTDVPVDVFAIRGGSYDEELSEMGVREITLKMNEPEGTTNSFYRIRAAIDTNVAVRVRIIRTDNHWGEGAGEDGEGLIEIDNIIVSYPAMGVKVAQYGAPADPDYPANGHLGLPGQRAPFDVAFPTADDLGSLHALVKVTYIANNTNTVDSSFIGALTMNYRWRYLDQHVGEWTELLLQPDASDPTKFVSKQAIVGEGVGDIEYNAAATVNAPFYEYWDYTGRGWAWPDGFSERRGDVAINAVRDGVYSSANLSPAFGTDYFIRLREGASDYEGFRLYVKKSGEADAKAQIIAMDLAYDRTWRGFYQTLTNAPNGLLYRIEAVNQQTTAGTDYQYNSTWYHGEDQTELPVNDVLIAGNETEWTSVPSDGVTGYLLFQLEDATHSLSIIHADYQNFNQWTDAKRDDACFVGTSTALPTSGVSRTACSYTGDFSFFTESIATNVWWIEHFDEPASEEGDWAIEQPFTGRKNSPNGWTVDSGKWVSQEFRTLGGDSIAFQMKGEGFGAVTFPSAQTPRGIGHYNFSARVAQTYDIHAFNYYVGTTNEVYNYHDYTFAVPCAMATAYDADFTGPGCVSALANYRDSKGGYELRAERISQNYVKLALYKWFADGSSQLLGRTTNKDYNYFSTGFSAPDRKFAALFISCTNTETSVRITAGILSAGAAVGGTYLSNKSYFKICYEDFDNPHRTGTFGVGAKDCPATFARPVFSPVPVAWATDWKYSDGNFHYWDATKTVSFGKSGTESVIIADAADYDSWNIYASRLGLKDFTNDLPFKVYGFKAQPPEQTVLVETAPRGTETWSTVTNVTIASFGFEEHDLALYLCDNLTIRVRTSLASGGADVVVDDFSLSQWRGENYDDSTNPDRSHFYDVGYGAPTNFVYTTAWIASDSAAEISAMRTTAQYPAGIRSPLMDGKDGRGLGLGQFTYAYRNAERHARLLVQICTNDIDLTLLADRTASVSGWTTVATNDFSQMTEEERENGLISTYIGLHGVKGVMRVIVDPELATEAHDHSQAGNPTRDPNYGQVFITAAAAKDNPALDRGSWWGWNLRTLDESSRRLLRDGSPNDPRVNGLSFALNNSIVDGVLVTDEYASHMPFLQTPIFTKGVVGEITFKARKYDSGGDAATVAVYGTTATDPAAKDREFDYLGEIVVDCDRYETFSYQAPVSKNYTAFRLAVTGVEGVTGEKGPSPASGKVRRVLLDEVAVFEAIRARLGFRNTGAFRNHLADNTVIAGMPAKSEQPLCSESWGVQTELYAAQLSDRIDLTTPGREPRVFLRWFEGTEPWGYYNWMDNENAHRAELARAEGTEALVYRSSVVAAPGAVIGPSTEAGSIVQYSLEVVYYMKDQADALTNVLSAVDWVKPPWYEPVDCNAQYGNGTFSAYNILDTVAPGWVWFNEVNLFGGYDANLQNLDKDYQYVEIAAPSEADLTDWQVQMTTWQSGTSSVRTNTVAIFGKDGLTGTKKDLLGQASGMVFRVIASLPTRKGKKITTADGTLDGVWTFPNPDGDILNTDGTISTLQPFGIRLLRPTGIIEHEIVVIGTNYWADSIHLADQFSPTNLVNNFNRTMTGAHFVYVGDDDKEQGRSLSVWDSRGETSNYWDRIMVCTPGRINAYEDGTPQIIPSDHPTPLGTTIFVYANLSGANIYQTVGSAVQTNADQVLVIQRGSLTGTDIVYTVDRWYELGEVTTNGVAMTTPTPFDTRTYRINVGKGASNNVTVIARAQVCEKLRNLGVDENNRYTPAIIDWVNKGVDMDGNAWPNFEDENIYLAQYRCRHSGTTKPMTLTEMYWLDMCPTVSNQELHVGWGQQLPAPHIVAEGVTNVRMSVYLAISNGMHATPAKPLEPPYVIRGLVPGSSSWDFADPSYEYIWTNASFRIRGILANGKTSFSNPDNWVGLRWFVFDRNSFYTEGEKAYTSEIEIVDPYSKESPGYEAGWSAWAEEHGYRPNVLYSWSIDERMRMFSVELLKTNNYYQSTLSTP